jgi:hypothetical protein
MYYSLVGAFGVAFGGSSVPRRASCSLTTPHASAGATEFVPELNSWLQLIKIPGDFKKHLLGAMVIDVSARPAAVH